MFSALFLIISYYSRHIFDLFFKHFFYIFYYCFIIIFVLSINFNIIFSNYIKYVKLHDIHLCHIHIKIYFETLFLKFATYYIFLVVT